jgi:short-subunit dehydrogenase
VKGLSDAVRDELRDDGIPVTAVYPMLVRTELAVGTKPARGGRWISPEKVGEAVAAAVERPRDEVFVPRWVSGVLRLQSALPPRGRAALARAFGVDKLYTAVDPATRAEYERRLAGG